MINVYLLLGSNLGNRQMFLHRAAEYIEAQAGHIIKSSSIFETQSWGKTDEPNYLNQVLLIQTKLIPQQLLCTVLDIELLLGRERKERWGARTLDIDILFYGDEIINEPELVIPHPQLHNRRFTLEPLVEISPKLLHPILRKTVAQLKSELKDKLQVKNIFLNNNYFVMSETIPNPELDLSFLYEIADGSDEFIVESIEMFSQQTPLLLTEIEQGIDTQNWTAAGSAAHKLKPNLGFFGMHSLQSMMQEIEVMAKGGIPDAATIRQKYITAKDLIEANLVKLEQIKAEKQG